MLWSVSVDGEVGSARLSSLFVQQHDVARPRSSINHSHYEARDKGNSHITL